MKGGLGYESQLCLLKEKAFFADLSLRRLENV